MKIIMEKNHFTKLSSLKDTFTYHFSQKVLIHKGIDQIIIRLATKKSYCYVIWVKLVVLANQTVTNKQLKHRKKKSKVCRLFLNYYIKTLRPKLKVVSTAKSNSYVLAVFARIYK